jgi:hypothetical protein
LQIQPKKIINKNQKCILYNLLLCFATHQPKVQRQEVLRILVQFSGPNAERLQLHRLINLPDPGKCIPQSDTPPNKAVRLHLASGETLEALELGMAIIPGKYCIKISS